MTKLLHTITLTAAGFLALALATPQPAQAAPPCAAACVVCGGNCSRVRCICDADGGALRYCGQCSDNDYMCINSCGPVDQAAAPVETAAPAFFAATGPAAAPGASCAAVAGDSESAVVRQN